ncbi:MAG TPA: BatD family protein [Bdellovibrionales bacterium]|nr:BatD family protein [Bdellovibrionales bacterium]
MFWAFALSVWIGLAPHAQAAEGVSVNATVDRNQIGVGDAVNLVISISSEKSITVEEPSLPDIKGMELVNTSTGVETRSSYSGGRFVTEQARTFNYMLVAQAQGDLKIPALSVRVDGQTYQTKPIDIKVSGQRGRQGGSRGQPIDPFGMLDEADEELFNQLLRRQVPGGGAQPNVQPFNPNEAFFIQSDTDKQKAYVGEQVTANFYLYTRGNIRDIDTLKYPSLKGFWKEEIEMATRLNFEQVVLNGIPYQRALLVSYALFPIKAGKAIVDQYKAKCTVITPSSFGFGRPYQFTKASRPLDIEVRDVPAEGRPQNFTGAVGRYKLSAKFEPPTGTTNQPVTLRIRFEGQGNAKLIELPNLGLPPTFELYDQKSQAKFMKDGTSYKEFEVLIIPREPGVFQIPAIAMAVFDPETAKFTSVASQPLTLTVTGAGGGVPAVAAGAGPVQPQAPAGPALPSLATDLDDVKAARTREVAVTVALFLAAFGFLGVTGWRRLKTRDKKVGVSIVLKRRLRSIRELAGKGEFRRVGVELTNATYYVLGQLTEEGGANQELSRLLEKTPPSLRRELAEPMQKLLASCEALSFAPEAMIGDMKDKAKLQALIAEFERVMNRAIALAEI